MKRNIKTITIILLLVGMVFSSSVIADLEKYDFIIKAGLIKKINDEKYVVYKETLDIPYITKKTDPKFKFGYTLHSNSNEFFYSHATLTSPSLEKVTGDLTEVGRSINGKVLSTTKRLLNKNYGYYWLSLDENDPPGLYSVNIFINDKLLDTIEFNVLSPK